jgi:CHASE1-domain containing sensor protein
VVLLHPLAASRISQARHDQEIRRVFDAESASMRNLVSRQIDLFFDVLHSIGQLHDLSDQISEQDFAEFTRKGMAFQQRVLSAYGFVQRMPHDVRAATDALLIVEPADDGSFATAGIRPEYFPLVYQNPADSLAIPVGTDLATLPGLPDAILRMIQRDGPVLARAIRLQGPSGDTGFFALSPLYQTSPEKALSGFTVSVLWPQQILEQALANVATRDVLVRFYDPGMHESPPADQPAAQLQVVENIAVADAEWRFEARASDEYLQARRSALPPLILTTGSAITLLLSVTIGLLAGRTRRIERGSDRADQRFKKGE